jgi:class 3 adenylate cyclase/tetratricopeptide (TPR) repeat protein
LSTRINTDGERKIITVLFTDVAGYTSMTEKLDLEVVREIMNNHFKILIEAVNNYRGTVDQLLGDGMVAFFGAPLAHEDHAQRACYAALAMQEAIHTYAATIRNEYGIDFMIRIGLNSGPVLVGPIGNDQHAEYIAIGDTVNLASRLESASRPGGILVSDTICSMAGDFFQFEPVGGIGIRGKENSVAAYRLIRALETERRFDAAVKRGLTPFVGRDKEMEILRRAFIKARNRNCRVVSIAGEPGIGKSRLLREFRESLDTDEFSYLEGCCLHYGSSTPFKPLVDIVKTYFDVREEDPETDIRDRMKEKLEQLGDGLAGYLPFLCEMLSIKTEDEHYLRMENQYKRSKLFEGLTYLLCREASISPLVVAIEDLHWIDKTSEEFLAYLENRISGNRILLILLYRPEYQPAWTDRSNYLEVHLNQLTASNEEELLRSLLPDGGPAHVLKDLVLTRTGGNPLFLEEFIHTLMDNGAIRNIDGSCAIDTTVSSIKLPDTVQGIIAGRIDRLPEELKSTLQVASVMGRDFSYTVLQDVLQHAYELKSQLETLQKLEFIARKNTSPDIEYIFKHALIQEVAYGSMLQKKRMELHGNIGQAIEKLYPNRLEGFFEVLAYHYQQSNSTDKAVEYLRKSGRKALERYAVEESHRYYQQTFDLISAKTDKTREEQLTFLDIILEWAEVYYYQGRFRDLIELLKRHENLAIAIGDKYRHAMLLGWLGNAYQVTGQNRESYQCLQDGLALAEESGEQKAVAYICGWLPWTCLAYGVTGEGMAYGERAVDVSRHIDGNDYPLIKALGGMGFLASYTGKSRKAYEYATRLLELGRKRGNLRSQAIGHWIMAMCYMVAGDIDVSIEECHRGIALNPDPFYLQMLRFYLGNVYVFSGRLQDGEKTLEQVISYGQEHGCECMEWPAKSMLAMCFIARGKITKGFNMISSMDRIFINSKTKFSRAFNEYCYGMVYSRLACPTEPVKISFLMRNLGFILRHAPFATRKAVLHYNTAVQICRDCGFTGWLGMVYKELGHLYQIKGKTELARENLSAAVELYRECEDMANLKQAEFLLESLEKR